MNTHSLLVAYAVAVAKWLSYILHLRKIYFHGYIQVTIFTIFEPQVRKYAAEIKIFQKRKSNNLGCVTASVKIGWLIYKSIKIK